MEVDFSKAAIAAILMALEFGSVVAYLQYAWKEMTASRARGNFFVLHICRFHSVRFLTSKIEQCYAEKPTVAAAIKEWADSFLRSSDLYSFGRSVRDAIILCGTKYFTNEVKAAYANLKKGTDRSGDPPWTVFRMEEIPRNGPLKLRSPWGFYAHRIYDDIKELQAEEEKIDQKGKDNPFHDQNFIEYLLEEIFPYSGMMDNSMLMYNDYSIKDGINNPCENYFKVLKQDEHKEVQRCGRFVRKHLDVIKGRCGDFEDELDGVAKKFEESFDADGNGPPSQGVGEQKAPDILHTTLPSSAPPRPPPRQSGRNHGQSQDLARDDPPPTDWQPFADAEGNQTDSEDELLATLNRTRKQHGQGRDGRKHKSSRNTTAMSLPENAEEKFKSVARPRDTQGESAGTIFKSLPRMPNGGHIIENNNLVSINCCCSFDNILFLLYALYKTVLPVRDFIKNMSIINHNNAQLFMDVFYQLDKSNFVKARTIVATKLVPQLRKPNNSFYASEEFMMARVTSMLGFVRRSSCPNSNCNAPKMQEINLSSDMRDLENPDTLGIRLNYGIHEECVGTLGGDELGTVGEPCRAKVHTRYEFLANAPHPFISYTMPWSREPKEDSLLPQYNILGERYKLFGYTLNIKERQHFVAILLDRGMYFKYDDVHTDEFVQHIPNNEYTVSSVFLVRAD